MSLLGDEETWDDALQHSPQETIEARTSRIAASMGDGVRPTSVLIDSSTTNTRDTGAAAAADEPVSPPIEQPQYATEEGIDRGHEAAIG